MAALLRSRRSWCYSGALWGDILEYMRKPLCHSSAKRWVKTWCISASRETNPCKTPLRCHDVLWTWMRCAAECGAGAPPWQRGNRASSEPRLRVLWETRLLRCLVLTQPCSIRGASWDPFRRHAAGMLRSACARLARGSAAQTGPGAPGAPCGAGVIGNRGEGCETRGRRQLTGHRGADTTLRPCNTEGQSWDRLSGGRRALRALTRAGSGQDSAAHLSLHPNGRLSPTP